MKNRLISVLRWSERYTKTDMVYLASTGLWINLNVVVMTAFSLLMSIVFANALSPQAYGMYQYLLSLSVLVAAVSLAGMNAAVAQAVARGYEGVLRISVREQLRWAIVPGSLALLGALYYYLQGNTDVALGLSIIAILTPLSNAYNTYSGFLEGKRAFRYGFYLTNLTNFASYAAILISLIWTREAVLLVIANLAANALAMAYCYYKTLKLYTPNDHIDPGAIPYGRHLSVMSAFSTTMNQLGSVLVFHFLGAAELAIYSLATLMPERVGSLFTFIGTASMPKFANHPLDYIREHLASKVGRIALAASIVALIYALSASLIFHLIFPRYLVAIHFSEAYAFSIVLLAVTSVTNMTLTAKRLTRESYVISFVQPLLLVGLQISLLITYGIWGMIFAKLLANSIGILLSLWFIYRPITPISEMQM